MMEQIRSAEVRTGPEYDGARQALREQLAAAQGPRRVSLGEDVELVFENRETVKAALEEFIRVQRDAGDAAVRAAVASFNGILAAPGSLLATVYVDVDDAAALGDRSASLEGLPRHLSLEVGAARVAARPGSGEDLGPGAASVAFDLDETQRRAWLSGAVVAVAVDHPALRARTTLTSEQAAAIGADLGG